MIVERWTFIVKQGCWDKFADLLKARRAQGGSNYRIYTCTFGTRSRMAIEREAESMADIEQFWATWSKTPEAAAFTEQFNVLTEPGTIREIWTLE